MNSPIIPGKLHSSRTTRTVAFACCVGFLLAFARVSDAQSPTFNQFVGTNIYNLFITDSVSHVTYNSHTDPDPGGVFGGDPIVPSFSSFPSYFFPSVSTPVGQVTIPPFTSTSVSASAQFELDDTPTGTGLTLSITNNSALPDEIRLDWAGNYQCTGGGAINGYTINVNAVNSGAGSYYEVASGETIFYAGNAYPVSMQNIAGTQNLYGPAGAGYWVGANSSGIFNETYTLSFGSAINVNSGDYLQSEGFVDVIVDPGSVKLKIEAITPPALGIGNYFGQSVVFFPTSPGTNYVLQVNTNLLTGTWSNVTNGIPFSGFLITNSAAAQFFRLH
jgi:hypothetical protein